MRSSPSGVGIGGGACAASASCTSTVSARAPRRTGSARHLVESRSPQPSPGSRAAVAPHHVHQLLHKGRRPYVGEETRRGSGGGAGSVGRRGSVLIEGRRLTKRFGDFVAVDGIDFAIEPGEAFGFLGPNGAGKTLDDADDRLRLAGHRRRAARARPRPGDDGPQIRARLGVVPQEDNLDTELTVWDNLLIYGRYFDLPARRDPRARRRAARVRAADRPARRSRSTRSRAA